MSPAELLVLLGAVHAVVGLVWLYDRPYNATRAIVDNRVANREAQDPVTKEP